MNECSFLNLLSVSWDNYGWGTLWQEMTCMIYFQDIAQLGFLEIAYGDIFKIDACLENTRGSDLIGGWTGGAVFTVTSSGVDESVMAWTRAAVASKEEMEEAGWREGHHNAPSIMLQFTQPTSQQNELEVRNCIPVS